MSIAQPPPKPQERPRPSPSPRSAPEQRLVLEGVSWATYDRLVTELDRGGIRLAYDRGRLEIMSPSFLHEIRKRQIGRMIEILAEELDLEIVGGGSTTFRREDAKRGLEPDECYWLAHAVAISQRTEIDLTTDPPPDLAIEVDLTSNSLNKQPIYASLRIPEVWRYDGRELVVLQLDTDGVYVVAERSGSFPRIPTASLLRFLVLRQSVGERQWTREFRTWIRSL
jgi:Uma2 family endonuclease